MKCSKNLRIWPCLCALCFLLTAVGHSQFLKRSSEAGLQRLGAYDGSTLDSTSLSVTTIASNLDVPWDIAWGPDDWVWYAEQSGRISKVNPVTGERKLILRIFPDVFRYRTRGLLAMALHPDMERFPYVVVNYHLMKGNEVWSRWARYTYDGEALINPLTLLEERSIAGHNGTRAAITPDGKVMLALGDEEHKNDTANSGVAQNMQVLGGKILRLNIDGTIPKDNPFPGSPIWALGFRVPQGLVYTENEQLYSAEHGHVTNDEVNLVKKGGNYGYPIVSGVCDLPHELDFCATHTMTPPLMAWTPTVAPSGLDYYNHAAIPDWKNSLLLVTLKTQSLRVLRLNDSGTAIVDEEVYFTNRFGRLRDVCVSRVGDVYIATSNLDWNPVAGFPGAKDDRIIRISANRNYETAGRGGKTSPQPASTPSQKTKSNGRGFVLYNNYCASCHKTDGAGLTGSFPPLQGSPHVNGNKHDMIRIVLQGMKNETTGIGQEYDAAMPGFHFLSDEEVADVVSYVRSVFGEGQGAVTAADVARARGKGKK